LASLIEAFAADLRPGCGSFESMTNVGVVQKTSEPTRLDTTGIGDKAVGWASTVTVSGTTSQAGVVAVLSGDRATLVQQIAVEVAPDQLLSVARAAATRAGS
jgi:hypothetical protein